MGRKDEFHGKKTGFPREEKVSSMGRKQDFHGKKAGVPREENSISMGRKDEFHGKKTGVPWTEHGSPLLVPLEITPQKRFLPQIKDHNKVSPKKHNPKKGFRLKPNPKTGSPKRVLKAIGSMVFRSEDSKRYPFLVPLETNPQKRVPLKTKTKCLTNPERQRPPAAHLLQPSALQVDRRGRGRPIWSAHTLFDSEVPSHPVI